jgi:hypothetical protein
MLQFLATTLDMETPVLSAFDGFSDQYWLRRREGATHSAAFHEVELLSATSDPGLDGDERTVCVSTSVQVSYVIYRCSHAC